MIAIVLTSDASDLGLGGKKGATGRSLERKTSQLHTQNHSSGPVLSSRFGSIPLLSEQLKELN